METTQNYKEIVLAYLKDRAGKETDPANDCSVFFMGFYWISMCGEHVLEIRGESSSEAKFAQAARILRLDKPRAAEIQWEDEGENEVFRWTSTCGNYTIEVRGDGYTAYYEFSDYHREVSWPAGTPELAKAACQAHKQAEYDRLGGR